MTSIATIISTISDIGIKRLYKFILKRVIGRYLKVIGKIPSSSPHHAPQSLLLLSTLPLSLSLSLSSLPSSSSSSLSLSL